MYLIMLYFFCLISVTPAYSKPRYTDLDEEDQQLFRSVYETPSYSNEEGEDDLEFDKMDLLKDGLWVVKAKLAELKAFNKALVSNLLSTKMKLKDLIKNHLPAKKHELFDKKKPHHNMYSPPPSYYDYPHIPQYPQYEVQPALPQVPQHGHDPYYGH